MQAAILSGYNGRKGNLDMFSGLATNQVKTRDTYIVHPAVLQTCTLESKDGSLLAGVPASFSYGCLPTASTLICYTSWQTDGLAIATRGCGQPHNTNQPAVSLQGVAFRIGLDVDAALIEHKAVLDLSNSIYEIEWLVSDVHQSSSLNLLGLSAHLLKSNCKAPLGLSQTASLAAADVLQMLHSHRKVMMKTLTVKSAGTLPAQLQPVPQLPAVAGAAIASILKNLPYEMPSVRSAVVDLDVNESGSTNTYLLSVDAPPARILADMYGAAIRGGASCRPQLGYNDSTNKNKMSPAVAIKMDSTYIITGGLGGIGLMTSNWTARSGAMALVLLSRTGTAVGRTCPTIVQQSGSTLMVLAKCNVLFSEDSLLLTQLANSLTCPSNGIMHTAGLQVLDCLKKVTLFLWFQF